MRSGGRPTRVRFAPKADRSLHRSEMTRGAMNRTHAAQQNLSLDHLVNALMNSRRCIQAQRLKKWPAQTERSGRVALIGVGGLGDGAPIKGIKSRSHLVGKRTGQVHAKKGHGQLRFKGSKRALQEARSQSQALRALPHRAQANTNWN